MDWHLVKGKYSCTCANTEDTNAFDRVICGILYRSNGYMLKSAIASIMGFNVIDNPLENRYIDQSEKAIFDNAVASLIEYNLVIDDGIALKLTESGKVSFETHTKHRTEDKDVELWTSEFVGSNFNPEVLKGLAVNSIEEQNHPEWNTLLQSPMDVLKIQNADLIDINAGRDVKSLICNGMDYYVVKLSCKICFNVESEQLFACSSAKSEKLDSVLSSNSLLQDRLLDKFFNEQNVSVIYKPDHQEDMEDFIKKQEVKDISYPNVISCKEEFLSKLNFSLKEENIPIIYFSQQKLTNDFRNYIKQIDHAIVCVDFIENYIEEFQDNEQYYIEANVCYHHVNECRTTDLCVCGSTYYSPLPYVVNYKGNDFNINLLFEYDGDKYNHSVLYSPFISHILDTTISAGQNSLNVLKKNPSVSVVNDVLTQCIYIDKMNFAFDNSNDIDKAKRIGDIAQEIIVVWNNSVHDRLNILEAEIIAGGDKQAFKVLLQQIELEANRCIIKDDDVLSHISEIKQRIVGVPKITGPKVSLQTVYILDTSIFMDLPRILERFSLSRDRVIVPRAMEQELDGLSHDEKKKANASLARLSLRRKKVDYPHFVSIKDNVNRELLPIGFDPNIKDNDMLATAIEVAEKETLERIVIVANDSEFVSNINDCVYEEIISPKIEAINLDELLIRLSE